jgi:RimJ/RimL family protein N-acetyltransferase
MKDPALLEATDSEPLSFEEEVDMQQSWRDDAKKCTFIVHSGELCKVDESVESVNVVENLKSMVGDVNLFLSEIDDDEEDDKSEAKREKTRLQAEIDIMVAKHGYTRKGIGRAATCAMLLYGANALGVHRFFCKINEGNKASIKLFESLGFVQCDYAACFKQVELELVKPLDELTKTLQPYGKYKSISCPL